MADSGIHIHGNSKDTNSDRDLVLADYVDTERELWGELARG